MRNRFLEVFFFTAVLVVLVMLAWLAPCHSAPRVRCFVYDASKQLVAVSASPVVAQPGQFVIIVDAEKRPTAAQIETAYAGMISRETAALKPKATVQADTKLADIEARLKAVEAAIGVIKLQK